MFDIVAAAALEMTAAAIFATRHADALSYFLQVKSSFALKHDGAGGITLGWGDFIIGACTVMADEAVNIFLIGKIKA